MINETLQKCYELQSNLTGLQYIDKASPYYYTTMTYNQALQALGDAMVTKFMYIGAVALICGAWHMSKYSRIKSPTTDFITGMIDMMAFGGGLAGIAFYLIYKGVIHL